MYPFFPYPSPLPLKRLSVEDGLLLNAERWQSAHAYHRHRQNLHYQSLNQPGIVCGLGVCPIAAPDRIASQYRDGKWIQIQTGMAIDLLGNPIIVPESMEFRIASEAKEESLIYLVISYVDPENLRRSEPQYIIDETFRIDEKSSPPSELEVEICRILLAPDIVKISASTNVFSPSRNELDLRYRKQAMARPQGLVRAAFMTQDYPIHDKISSSLSSLMQSVAALYPAMQGIEEVEQIKLQTGQGSQPLDCDIFYLTYQQFTGLRETELEVLKEYALSGGVLLVELLPAQSEVGELIALQQKLQKALADFHSEGKLNNFPEPIKAELEATTVALEKQLDRLCLPLKVLAKETGGFSEESGVISRQHLLRNQPFLFGQFPAIAQQEVKILNWGGIILVIGNLSAAWGLDGELAFPRETIRSAQEMGINFLHFAWQRRYLTQLQWV